MFLFFFEDGAITKSEHIPEDIIQNAKDGICEIIDTKNMMIFSGFQSSGVQDNPVWEPIEEYNHG